jgi:cation:H+ antiporter
MANLTGALRLLTGFGWPVIYFTAAFFHRRQHGKPMRVIQLHEHHAVEVMGLLTPLLYMAAVTTKGTLTIYDGFVLIGIYATYLAILSKLPPEDAGSIQDLEVVPRTIVMARKPRRILAIAALFAAGGGLIYYSAEPFLGSLLALSALLGIPTFVFVQWAAPVVSEFPEMASTFYWARTVVRAPVALMNMVSSNINQWTLLAAMLPIVYSISSGQVEPIRFDEQQTLELWMTLGQAAMGMMFLINMELAWWEATALFVLFVIPFAQPGWAKPVTAAYFIWVGFEALRMLVARRKPPAAVLFRKLWGTFVRPSA